MYTGPDQSWRNLPRFLDLKLAKLAFRDIGQYAVSRKLVNVTIVLHGGEPSLVSEPLLRTFVEDAKNILASYGIGVRFCIQTNGYNLPRQIIETWLELGIDIGISVDLTAEAHNRNRVDKRGNGSYRAVRKNLECIRMASSGAQPAGLLSVIDPLVPPPEAWAYLESFGVGFVDLLLPDETWETADSTDLADRFGPWLCQFWDIYASSHHSYRIRWFYTLIKLFHGGMWGSDSVGMSAAGVLIVETDGRYVFHDALRMAERDINETGYSAGSLAIGTIEMAPIMAAMTLKTPYLHSYCSSCDLIALCGGGHIVHRYSKIAKLDNPSVYCEALKIFYNHVRSTLELREVST